MRNGMLAIVLMVGCVSGCGPVTSPGQKTTATIVVKGSDTMVHLVAAWSEAYMKIRPDIEISVTGGGSGTGIAALLNKTTDLCAASREISPTEMEQAKQKGIVPQEVVVARDGIAVIVHPDNPVSELTLDQIRKIYTGAYSNWNEVGGLDGRFLVLSRESSSGTYVFFQEHVLRKEDYAPNARLMPATSAILQAVTADVLAIGYVGLGYVSEAANRVKALRIKKDVASPAVVPCEDTVRDGSYSISRPLYLYADAQASEMVKDFLAFCLGYAGQAIVREAGYVPVE